MRLQVLGSDASVEVADSAFAREFNETLVHQAVTAYMAGGRAGTKAQKTRAEVRGGGAKPWKQKGAGRARAGTIRSPLWRGGGRAFAARPRDYGQKLNKKMYRAAMASIFSELARQDRLVLVESLVVDSPKTRGLLERLGGLGVGENVLVVTELADVNLYLAARNLPYVEVSEVSGLDPVSLVRFERVLITVPALKRVEEWLA
ncbi:MAG: 50S ribosomal protein L4 [Chromatiales bacterium]|jgi:large subunit ribosomal protein L4|nr:50S ribosomal protein L4 [Chromatiales bacterium]MDX9765896.1 50S ribosomal protein L4 [Ectothiorhodospiraceae bacterium]